MTGKQHSEERLKDYQGELQKGKRAVADIILRASGDDLLYDDDFERVMDHAKELYRWHANTRTWVKKKRKR